ncbi:cytochrome O ubiquinol oxidase [Macrococcus hajekii]|uniref:Cytochrome O ubiquinol oxidase n=1 Tax=Macrococcus hajekii TaxID=198482 RepID=A0A4R6BN64_9STAP|nr:VTT domain-containing protein [Macrococcus hajekii]TDM03127.1 cytochrome O ubiquinol oxidase [Macrococcus hajekii]GGA96181.1 cytochrome o ubiquinol oxidase [Macrococcus hajekii]
MNLISQLIDFILHIDEHLIHLVSQYGTLTYGILFLIIFVETGLVMMPFLPGDSMLFAAAALAPQGALNIWILFVVCFVAAVIGDTLNYHIGKAVGLGVTKHPKFGRFIKEEHMIKATHFFNKYGGKTIVMARFMPFIRTFIPFVAGASRMHYSYFILYNIIGAFLWVAICLGLGYFFGNIPVVKDNFEIVLILIILVSVLPAIFSAFKAWRENRRHS